MLSVRSVPVARISRLLRHPQLFDLHVLKMPGVKRGAEHGA